MLGFTFVSRMGGTTSFAIPVTRIVTPSVNNGHSSLLCSADRIPLPPTIKFLLSEKAYLPRRAASQSKTNVLHALKKRIGKLKHAYSHCSKVFHYTHGNNAAFLNFPTELRIEIYICLFFGASLMEYRGLFLASRQIKQEMEYEWFKLLEKELPKRSISASPSMECQWFKLLQKGLPRRSILAARTRAVVHVREDYWTSQYFQRLSYRMPHTLQGIRFPTCHLPCLRSTQTIRYLDFSSKGRYDTRHIRVPAALRSMLKLNKLLIYSTLVFPILEDPSSGSAGALKPIYLCS